MDLSTFKNKKVLITGAGRGIGRDLAKTLATGGSIVYALSKSKENLEALQKECPNIRTIVCDLANWKETEEAVKNIEPLDYLVNNAGVAIRQQFFDMKEEDVDLLVYLLLFQFYLHITYQAVLNVTRLVSKKMVDAKIKGSIVNVSSLATFIQNAGSELTTYGVTKAAVDKITKGSAIELAQYKIRVDSVNPTIVMTDMGQEIWSDRLEMALSSIPLGQFAEVSHCINAILFLLSDLSAMTTGGFFLVDGGGAL